mmetsp:Transcript_2449/g.4322  ORF Transcript_2449/g.4322 Transcript_2449/m.4322 type:complete len:105 (-) Transcript_2449:921-1235(-)
MARDNGVGPAYVHVMSVHPRTCAFLAGRTVDAVVERLREGLRLWVGDGDWPGRLLRLDGLRLRLWLPRFEGEALGRLPRREGWMDRPRGGILALALERTRTVLS